MSRELQSKGVFVFNRFVEAGLRRSHRSDVINTTDMDKFINNCKFYISEDDCVQMEWDSEHKNTRLTFKNQPGINTGLKISGTVQKKPERGYLSKFQMDATTFHIMDRAWFFSNGKETIRIFNNGDIWLDNELGHFIVAPINS